MAQYDVTYLPRNGVEMDATAVRVDRTTDHEGRDVFYATNLALWGCGKNAATPEDAIRLLVQDQARIVAILGPY